MSFFKKLFGLERPATPDTDDYTLLTTVYSNEELISLRALLDSVDIPYFWADRGAGGVTRLIVGNTCYGTDLFVPPDRLDEARDLLQAPACDEKSDSPDDQNHPE